jgi:HD-like signal output (HDOD) protein
MGEDLSEKATAMRPTDVLDQLHRLPMRPTTVTRVLATLDDPDASADQIAHALSSDPSLTARVLQLANSPFYGLSGRVGSTERAVIAVGSSVLRTLAVSAAAGLFSQHPEDMPPGFWQHSVAVAAGSEIAGRMADMKQGDGLCAGLLHDLGAALLFRFDHEHYFENILGEVAPSDLLRAEVDAYAADHAMIGALALEQWNLPPSILVALLHHHRPPMDVDEKLGRVVIAGEALAQVAFDDPWFRHEPAVDPEEAFFALGLHDVSIDSLVSRTAEDTATIEGVFVGS